MRTKGGVSFYMYKGDVFIERALAIFEKDIPAGAQDRADAVEEAKTVREKQEVREELPPGSLLEVGGMFPVTSGFMDAGIQRHDAASGMTWQSGYYNLGEQARRAAQIAQIHHRLNQHEDETLIAVLNALEQQKRASAALSGSAPSPTASPEKKEVQR
jgi:hypothetical protein